MPLIYQQIYDSKDFYGKIKTVLTVHSVDEFCNFSRSAYDKVGVTLPKTIKGDTVNCYEAAAPFADLIVAVDSPSNDVTSKLLELPGIQTHKKKIVSISIDDEVLKEDKEVIEDLIIVAVNQAINNISKKIEDTMNVATGGMLGRENFPGI